MKTSFLSGPALFHRPQLTTFFSILLGLLLVQAHSAIAQQPAEPAFHGVLRNSAGAPISGAKIQLTATSAHSEAVTGADGQFQLSPLAPGQYRLTLEANGRKVEYAQPVELSVGAPAVALTLSDRGEVTVALLKVQVSTGGEELSSQAVSELPLNKRDFSTLLLLAAGTMTDANGATNFTQQFAINGQRGVEATFAMDGADISDPEMGGATFSNFNVDAVEGIDSSSGWMPAEIGRGAAGLPTSITRSGASGFHGSFFEFVRNSAFDARNYFDHATPGLSRPHSALSPQRVRLHQWRARFHPARLRRPQAYLLLRPVPGLSPGSGHHAGHARARLRQRRAGIDHVIRDVIPTGP